MARARVRPVRPPAGLASKPLGWTEVVQQRELELRTTTTERTLVDVLDRPELAGGIQETWDAYDASGVAIDPEAALAYARTVGKKVLAAKLGFFLESRQEELAVGDSVLGRLERLRPSSTVYWDRSVESRKAPRWNLMVPKTLLDTGCEGA